MAEIKQKILAMEEKISHLDYLLEALNTTIFKQNQKIDELELMLKHLAKQQSNKEESSEQPIELQNDLPPHY
jgi:SlyX protein